MRFFYIAGDSLVVLGGTKGERLRTAEVYEPRMDKWQPLSCPMIEVALAPHLPLCLWVVGGVCLSLRLL